MWTLLRKAYATQWYYPGNYVSFLAIQSVTQLLTLFYLYTVYTYTDELNGWTREEAVFIFYLANIVILCAECFTCSLEQYYRKLVQGRLDPMLALPIKRRSLQLLRWSEPGFMIPVLFLLCIWPWVDPSPQRGLLEWISGVLALGLGVLTIIILFALISLPALLTQRQAPADFMISELSRMVFLPSGILPQGGWKFVLGICIPLLFSANAAGEILVKGEYGSALALLMGGLTLGTIHRVLEARLLHSYSYPGS
ncbi:ABC-2 family transporter protein [Xenorhabdus nematophila]|uniref:ABC-2 family transporter protein n=1 Tax=Xenorhabdus nematophila TaxID=628 RepID=UPI0032B7CE7D